MKLIDKIIKMKDKYLSKWLYTSEELDVRRAKHLSMFTPCDGLSKENMKSLCDILGENVYEEIYGKGSQYQIDRQILKDIYNIDLDKRV